MNSRVILIAAGLFFSQLCHVAQAETPPAPEIAESPDAPPQATAAVETKLNKMPRLSIKWACDTCVANEKVIPLLDSGYSNEVTKNGKIISNDEIAEAVIVEFRQRNPANRSLFGVFAGKDILALKINYKGQELIAKDYYANAWQGMNALCESVAQISYQMIAELNTQ